MRFDGNFGTVVVLYICIWEIRFWIKESRGIIETKFKKQSCDEKSDETMLEILRNFDILR